MSAPLNAKVIAKTLCTIVRFDRYILLVGAGFIPTRKSPGLLLRAGIRHTFNN